MERLGPLFCGKNHSSGRLEHKPSFCHGLRCHLVSMSDHQCKRLSTACPRGGRRRCHERHARIISKRMVARLEHTVEVSFSGTGFSMLIFSSTKASSSSLRLIQLSLDLSPRLEVSERAGRWGQSHGGGLKRGCRTNHGKHITCQRGT